MIKLPNGETEFMKYKKAQPLLEQGPKYFNVYEKMGKLIFRYTEDYFKKFNRELNKISLEVPDDMDINEYKLVCVRLTSH